MRAVLPVLISMLAAPLLAGDFEKKDPKVVAAENLKMAKSMKEEAAFMEKEAQKLQGDDAAIVKDYAKFTAEEAEWLFKSSEAYGKNQFRLGERHQQKAAEYCEKRGKLLKKLEEIRPKFKADDKGQNSPTNVEKLAEIERKQAELEAEKKKLLEKNSGGPGN